MKMSKQEALKNIRELEAFVEQIDKPTPLKVYIKSAGGSCFTTKKAMIGHVCDVKSIESDDNLRVFTLGHDDFWFFSPDSVVVVEGSIEEFKEKNTTQMRRAKEEAQERLQALHTYVESLDKRPVMVYIKHWDERPGNWRDDGKMDYLQGTIQPIVSKSYSDKNVNIPGNEDAPAITWSIRKEDLIIVEGSFDDLE